MEDPKIEESPVKRTTMNKGRHIDPSSFFAIIMPLVVSEGKLGLPRAFVKAYGNELSTTVRLTVPPGGIWNVGIERAEDGLWLRDGWQNFADHHNIRYGHFLVFKYRGNSEFGVVIFDRTCTEIQYPSSSTSTASHVAQAVPEQEKACSDKDDKRIEILDSEDGSGRTCSSRKKSKGRGSSDEEKMWEVHVTRMFSSGNPYFAAIMRDYNLRNSLIVHVPSKFSRTYLSGLPNFVELQDSANKKWPVGTVLRHGRIINLSKGWSQFAKEKELRKGDVCVFELIQPTQLVLKVTIFRAKELAQGN